MIEIILAHVGHEVHTHPNEMAVFVACVVLVSLVAHVVAGRSK